MDKKIPNCDKSHEISCIESDYTGSDNISEERPMKFIAFIITLIIFTGISMFFMYQQNMSIVRLRQKLAKDYLYVSLGEGLKSGFKNLVMICANEDLIIREAYVLKGITVFDRMRKFNGPIGLYVPDIPDGDLTGTKMSEREQLATKQAAQFILNAVEKQKNGELEIVDGEVISNEEKKEDQ